MKCSAKMQATVLWVLAILITLTSIVYQRRTGPTYPIDGEVTLGDASVHYHLLRSQNTGETAEIVLTTEASDISAMLIWRRYRSQDDWQTTPFESNNGTLKAALPTQPPAGKIMYTVDLLSGSGEKVTITEEPVFIRFKGAVPGYILGPHILFMFFSMLLATRTGLAAFVHSDYSIRYAYWTATLLMLGGLFLGPVVQKYAFDAFWTGWPWGHDLTDNKTFVAFLFWVIAFWRHRVTGSSRKWLIIASVVQLMIYLIPHSVLGSELDYTQIEN